MIKDTFLVGANRELKVEHGHLAFYYLPFIKHEPKKKKKETNNKKTKKKNPQQKQKKTCNSLNREISKIAYLTKKDSHPSSHLSIN